MAKIVYSNFENKNYNDLQKRLLRAMAYRKCSETDLAKIIDEKKYIPSRKLDSICALIKKYLKEGYDAETQLSNNTGKRIEIVIAFAKALNVSSDYLLGLSNTMSVDMELRQICDKTGLSEKAIGQFKKELALDSPSSYSEKINTRNVTLRILESEEFYSKIVGGIIGFNVANHLSKEMIKNEKMIDVTSFYAKKVCGESVDDEMIEYLNSEEFQKIQKLKSEYVLNASIKEFIDKIYKQIEEETKE